MKFVTHILVIIFFGLVLYGCSHGVQPRVRDFDVAAVNSDAYQLDNIILTKTVILEHAKEREVQSQSDKTVGATTSSNFGKDSEIANLDCFLTGLREIFTEETIITPAEFWKAAGEDKDTLSLASLFDEHYSYINNFLDLDYLVVAYHQYFNHEPEYTWFGVEGYAYDNDDREVAAAITVDMKSKEVIDVIEIEAKHLRGTIFYLYVIPFGSNFYPLEDPCKWAGNYAAKAISESENKTLRIAVIAGEWKSARAEIAKIELESRSVWKLEKEIGTYCPNADLGHADAQKHIGDLYSDGFDGVRMDLVQAYVWYSLAANGGDKEAANSLRHVISILTADQLLIAKQRLKLWEPGQCRRDLLNAASVNAK